jgi:hypothetical protein
LRWSLSAFYRRPEIVTLKENCRPTVPVTKIQRAILRLLAPHRDPGSYVAGSTPLNIKGPRFSNDIDVFHDLQERVAQVAARDAAFLEARGYTLQWLRRDPHYHSVSAARAGEATRLEWVFRSDFRFFPTIPDKTFGYVLHPADLAVNKLIAAHGRREPRDIVDLPTIHEKILPLGAIIWASVGKTPALTPQAVIREIRSKAPYKDSDCERISGKPSIDPAAAMARAQQLLNQAEDFVARMPMEKAGLLFLKEGQAVLPDPARLDDYQTHAGRQHGHWPANARAS